LANVHTNPAETPRRMELRCGRIDERRSFQPGRRSAAAEGGTTGGEAGSAGGGTTSSVVDVDLKVRVPK
jgi:hypothetical protein